MNVKVLKFCHACLSGWGWKWISSWDSTPSRSRSPCSSALMTPQPSDTREWLEIPMKLPVKAVFWKLFSLWRSWKTCCPHGQSHPSSVETRRRSTCKIMTSARARHLVTAGRLTMTARTKRAATTAREYSVPTSNLMRFPTLTYTHTDTHNPWARWEKMYELQTKQRQVRLSSSSDTDHNHTDSCTSCWLFEILCPWIILIFVWGTNTGAARDRSRHFKQQL